MCLLVNPGAGEEAQHGLSGLFTSAVAVIEWAAAPTQALAMRPRLDSVLITAALLVL